jgi:hypothetical protein
MNHKFLFVILLPWLVVIWRRICIQLFDKSKLLNETFIIHLHKLAANKPKSMVSNLLNLYHLMRTR